MATPGKSEPLTVLLERARQGEPGAADQVLPLVYEELRRLAGRQLGPHAAGRSLQATDLVHEAYLRLLGREAPWEDRRHFFCTAARVMRSVLVDHVRARKAQKRGGDQQRSPLTEAAAWYEERSIDVLALDEALERLDAVDAAKRTLVELRFFAGLSVEDAARLLGVSRATAEREWTVARAWLRGQLSGGAIPA
jgi:RNA polymerase sigma factor (TIGR02999 family)